MGNNPSIQTFGLSSYLTLGAIHASNSIQHADGRLAWLGARTLEGGAPLWEQVVLESLHDELLALTVVSE